MLSVYIPNVIVQHRSCINLLEKMHWWGEWEEVITVVNHIKTNPLQCTKLCHHFVFEHDDVGFHREAVNCRCHGGGTWRRVFKLRDGLSLLCLMMKFLPVDVTDSIEILWIVICIYAIYDFLSFLLWVAYFFVYVFTLPVQSILHNVCFVMVFAFFLLSFIFSINSPFYLLISTHGHKVSKGTRYVMVS